MDGEHKVQVIRLGKPPPKQHVFETSWSFATDAWLVMRGLEMTRAGPWPVPQGQLSHVSSLNQTGGPLSSSNLKLCPGEMASA